MEPSVTIEGLAVMGDGPSRDDPAKHVLVARIKARLIGARRPAHSRVDVVRAPFLLQQGRGTAPVRLEAAGLTAPGTAIAELIAEFAVSPRDFELISERDPRLRWTFCWARGERDPTLLCSHSRTRPSTVSTHYLFDTNGAVPMAVYQRRTFRACCIASMQQIVRTSLNRMNTFNMTLYRPTGHALTVVVRHRRLTIQPGQYLIVNPSEIAWLHDRQRWPATFTRLSITQPALKEFRDAVGLPKVLGGFDFESRPRRLSGAVSEALDLWDWWTKLGGRAGTRLWGLSAVRSLLIALLHEHPNALRDRWERSGGAPGRDPRLEAAVALLQTHVEQPMTLGEVARRAGVGSEWLRRRFHEVWHQSPRQFLQDLRMRKARALLADPQHTIEEVAQAVGYQSVRPFYRIFRAYTRMGPSAFRSRLTSP